MAVVLGSAALGAETLYIADRPQAAASTVPSSAWIRVQHTDLTQPDNSTCAPTSAAMMMSALGVRETVPQLSALMHIDRDHGATTADLMDAINHVQPARWQMVHVPVDSPLALEKLLTVDLSAGVPVVEFVSDDKIPWKHWAPGGHAILVDGIDQAGGVVSVWDPIPGSGAHSITSRALFTMLWSDSGDQMAFEDVPNV